MSAIQKNVEAASEKYSSGFTKGHLALPPAKKYLVLTCMDARIDPAQAFGIELGDAHVIRNVSWYRLALSLGWIPRIRDIEREVNNANRLEHQRTMRYAASSFLNSCLGPRKSCWLSTRDAAC
jgi:hypothetical protein